MNSWLFVLIIGCSIAFAAFGAANAVQNPKLQISDNGADYDLFAVLTGTNCAQQLAYGPSDVTQDGQVNGANTAYLSTDTAGRNTAHTEWLQIVTSDGVTELFRIYWTFATARTLADHFVSAVNVGEAVSYRVVRADGTNYFYNGVWHFSDDAGDMAVKFSTPTTLASFSDSNGAWGAGQGDIDGSDSLSRTSPVQFWGVGTFQGTDANSCIHVYQQSDPTYFPYVKTYMYYASPVAGPVYPTVSPTRAPSAPTATPTVATTVANVADSYDLFAVLTGTTCAEALVYGPSAVTTGGQVNADNTAYLSTGTAGKNDAHNEWLQVVTSDGVTELFRIYWTFATARTLADHFITAVNVGEAVSYRVVTPDGTVYNYNGVWHFSDEAGDMAAKFASTVSIYGFSANGGAWGAGEGAVDGNVPLPRTSPVQFWGVGNFEGTDFDTCIHVYQQSDRTYYPFVRTYMYYSTVPIIDLTPTAKPSAKPKVAPTQKPNAAPTVMPVPLPVAAPTEAPIIQPIDLSPTAKPSAKPKVAPTQKPNAAPTVMPVPLPVAAPTEAPIIQPIDLSPTAKPSAKPKVAPTQKPNAAPTVMPVPLPVAAPTDAPVNHPTEKPNAVPTGKPVATPTEKPNAVPTGKPVAEPTGKPIASPTAKPNAAPTGHPISTHVPTRAPSRAPTHIPTFEPTLKPSESPTGKPVALPTRAPTTDKPNAVPTHAPVVTTAKPSCTPTRAPTSKSSVKPTSKPSFMPTIVPTRAPSRAPTFHPSVKPTSKPTLVPTRAPSRAPTFQPSVKPSLVPTHVPTRAPTRAPTGKPVLAPTAKPVTRAPTVNATSKPSLKPSLKPTIAPTAKSTFRPTFKPSLKPTIKPSVKPTLKPSFKPSLKPTLKPTVRPTRKPSAKPTNKGGVTSKPSRKPTKRPSRPPTRAPSVKPKSPSRPPTRVPTRMPTKTQHRQINCKVVQVIIGITIWWYEHNPHGCNSVLRAAIAAAIHGIAIGDIQEPEVYEAFLTADSGNLRVAVQEEVPEGITVEYTISVDADSGLTYDDISTQLVSSVESNQFATMLHHYAIEQNVSAFANATSLSIETSEVTVADTDSSSGDGGSDAMGGNAIMGLAIGVCVLLLISAYAARLYVLRRAAGASQVETTVAESPMTAELATSKHEGDAWTDNPLSAYSSHGTDPSAPQAPLNNLGPLSVMAVPMAAAGISTVGVAVAEACEKEEA